MTEEQPAIIRAEELDAIDLRPLFAHSRIVRREVLENVGAVKEALDAARQAAASTRERVEQEADDIRREARRTGFAEGMKEALEHVARAETARADARRAAERDMLDLAFELAERIVGRVLDRDDAAFRDLVADKLKAARGAPRIVVRVPPDAARTLEASRSELAAHVDGVPLTFEPDPALGRGDCIIETDRGRIDARIAVQLETLRTALAGGPDD